MAATSLFSCYMSVNGQQASNWRIKKNLCAKFQVQLSLAVETQMFKYLMHIHFDHEWGNSHISQNHNQADVKIMWKKTSHTKLSWVWDELYALLRNFTTWKWTSKVESHPTALAFINEIFILMTKFASVTLCHR